MGIEEQQRRMIHRIHAVLRRSGGNSCLETDGLDSLVTRFGRDQVGKRAPNDVWRERMGVTTF